MMYNPRTLKRGASVASELCSRVDETDVGVAYKPAELKALWLSAVCPATALQARCNPAKIELGAILGTLRLIFRPLNLERQLHFPLSCVPSLKFRSTTTIGSRT